SFLRGRGDDAGAAGAALSAYWTAAALGLVLAAVVIGAARPLAELAGGHGAELARAVTYLRVAGAGMPFVLVMLAGNGHLRGLADTRTPLRITLLSNVFNVAIEVGLVYGLGWGVAGSALGTVLAQILAAALFLRAGWGRGRVRPPRRLPDPEEVRRLLASGRVLVVRTVALLLALDGSTVVAARLGVVRLGGHQIALQVWFLVALSLDALAVPAQILIGEAFGASDRDRAALIARRVLRLGLIMAAGLGALTAALAPVLPALFTSDGAVRHQALIGIVFVGATLPLAAAAFELDGILIGAGDFGYLRFAMLVALAGFAPLGALTWVDHGLGLPGVWGAMGCWLATRAFVLWRRWRSDLWRRVP